MFVTPANNNAGIIQPIKRHLTESMNQVFGLQKLDSREQMKTFRPTADKQYLKVTAFRNKRAKKADRFQLIHTVIPEDSAERVQQKRVCQEAILNAQADQTAPEVD